MSTFKGVEIDLVVKDSLVTLAFYASIFDVKRIEVGDFIQGQNEVVIEIEGTRFHMLDENVEYQLVAPKEGSQLPIWFNVIIEDITETYNKAMNAGGKGIQPPTAMKEMGVTNALFADPFGYTWMLHQIHEEISYEERVKFFEEQGFQRRKGGK